MFNFVLLLYWGRLAIVAIPAFETIGLLTPFSLHSDQSYPFLSGDIYAKS